MRLGWTNEEIEILRRDISNAEAVRLLPGRSKSAVRRKRQRGCLDNRTPGLEHSGDPWTGDDDTLLHLTWGTAPKEVVAKQLRRTPDAIRHRAAQIGAHVPELKRPAKSRYMDVLREECAISNVGLAEALSGSRRRVVAHARFRAWARLRGMNFSLPGIGLVAGKHHTTILGGVRRFEAMQAAE